MTHDHHPSILKLNSVSVFIEAVDLARKAGNENVPGRHPASARRTAPPAAFMRNTTLRYAAYVLAAVALSGAAVASWIA